MLIYFVLMTPSLINALWAWLCTPAGMLLIVNTVAAVVTTMGLAEMFDVHADDFLAEG